MKKKQKRGYEAYKERKKQEEKKNKYKINEDDKIVIENSKHTILKIFSLIFYILEKILKLVGIIVITIILTIGLTMIFNPGINIIDLYNGILNNLNIKI